MRFPASDGEAVEAGAENDVTFAIKLETKTEIPS
jgi:hypothetical protein